MDLGGAKRSRSPSAASPVAFCLLFRHGKRRSPPAGGEIPRVQRTQSEPCPLIRHGFAVPPSPWKGEGFAGDRKGRPYGITRAGSVGSSKPGAEVEPHQLQFLSRQGPVARREFRSSLRFCAPEGFCLLQGVTPVMGSGADSPCQGEMSRSDRGGRVAVLWT